MALARYFTKWIRDACKSAYDKKENCEICDVTEPLEFHHYSSLSELVAVWQKKNLVITSDEEALEHRGSFIEEYRKEIYDDTVTLCKSHHTRLHSIYGKNPKLATAKKQVSWVKKQRDKHGLA